MQTFVWTKEEKSELAKPINHLQNRVFSGILHICCSENCSFPRNATILFHVTRSIHFQVPDWWPEQIIEHYQLGHGRFCLDVAIHSNSRLWKKLICQSVTRIDNGKTQSNWSKGFESCWFIFVIIFILLYYRPFVHFCQWISIQETVMPQWAKVVLLEKD